MGSTVILLFARDAVSLSPALLAGQALRMGQEIGMMRSGAAGKGGDAA
jgi:hypothetical protein